MATFVLARALFFCTPRRLIRFLLNVLTLVLFLGESLIPLRLLWRLYRIEMPTHPTPPSPLAANAKELLQKFVGFFLRSHSARYVFVIIIFVVPVRFLLKLISNILTLFTMHKWTSFVTLSTCCRILNWPLRWFYRTEPTVPIQSFAVGKKKKKSKKR